MVTFPATPAQILEGTTLTSAGCTITCASTGDTLREGDEVCVLVRRHKDSEAWSRYGVYEAADDATHPSPTTTVEEDYDRIMAFGRLAVASDQATQSARLVLYDIEEAVVARAGERGHLAGEGGV